MTEQEIQSILLGYLRNAREADNIAGESDKYTAEVACAMGVVQAMFHAMYNDLPADSFLKTWIPEYLAERDEELKQRMVIMKLES